MPFMQVQITNYTKWIVLEDHHGEGQTFPYTELTKSEVKAVLSDDIEEQKKKLSEYVSGDLESVSVKEGYGVRLSAPGYMDHTEWDVYDTSNKAADRAKELAEETYSDEESEEYQEFVEMVDEWEESEGELPLEHLLPL